MKKLFIIVGILFYQQVQGQNLNPKNAGEAIRTPIEVTFYGFGMPTSDDIEFMPQLQSKISENKGEHDEELEILKKAKMLLKKQFIADNSEVKNAEKGTRLDGPVTPKLEVGYDALNSQGTPPDNTIAVNKSNQIVAVVNSSLRFYNATTGASLAAITSLATFFSTLSNTTLATNNLCDPKVIFDPQADRFIIFAQTCEGNSSTSQIVMAFSKTSNPTQGWFFYGFSGNQSAAVGETGWFDYPKIGVSDHDFFVTGNIFSNSMNYIQSVIFQIDKTKCYAGNSLGNNDAVVFSNITNDPFTMVPITNGQSGGYGNNMYLISVVNGGFSGTDTRLNVFEINDIVQNNPTISVQQVDIVNAPTPADAIQKGTNVELDMGDNRGQDGFYLNGLIHFVFHGDVGNGFGGVIYHRLKKNTSNNWIVDKQQTIKATGKDYSYPSIASMGYDGNDQAAIIGFSYASSTEFPGMKAVFINKDGAQSPTIEIRTGTGFVDLSSTNSTRWGDYSSMSRVLNATKPTAWFFSNYGLSSSNVWRNHFAKITTAAWPTGTLKINELSTKTTIYPNPVVEDIVHLDINLNESGTLLVDLLDMNGRYIKQIYKTNAAIGDNTLSFNKGHLANGNYIVSIRLNNTEIKNEKITVLTK